MVIREIGNRGVFFTFDGDGTMENGGTSVYLINGQKRIYLCDTYIGPDCMEEVKTYIREHNMEGKEIVVFNSHSDWDHIWGNIAFENSTIIGHKLCRQIMEEEGEYDLNRLITRYKGQDPKLKLPTLTFDSLLEFEDDEIQFVYAPGHTICSAICYDKREEILFVGDLVEYPIVYLGHYDLTTFIDTLEFIKTFPAKTILSSHSGIVDYKLIDDNIRYLKDVVQNKPLHRSDEDSLKLHHFNIKYILRLRYEELAKEKQGKDFDLKTFREGLWRYIGIGEDQISNDYINMLSTEYNALEKALKEYVGKL